MIISGKPELGLQKHQQDAYGAVQEAFLTGNTASVVIPTGCGKSFVALQLMADNRDKNILFMAPSFAIKNQMYNYIAKYIVGEEPSSERPAKKIAEEYFPNLKIVLYPSLLRMEDKMMEKLNPDIIIMDELHRTGAEKWGERVNKLLEINPNAKTLGLTATPDRMDDKNVIDDLFKGKVDYELTLVEAIRRRIVKAPTYVKCDYALGEYLEGIRTAIANCNNEQQKLELQAKYDKMRRIVDQAEGIPELFAKNIKKKDGKYIIFCKDKEHMEQMMSKAKEWFGAIDSDPEIYSVYSGEGYSESMNRNTIESFEKSKSKHIKLLFSVDMLNEGLHVEDISGVVMARPTDSRILYLQQLGRALSSDTTREQTIVFDLVNNYIKNNLDAEINNNAERSMNNINNSNREYNGEVKYETDDIDIFRIQGVQKEFLELYEEVQGIINQSGYLINAREIKKWIEESGDTKPPSSSSTNEEEKRLGRALSRIRNRIIKPYNNIESEEEREAYKEKYPDIDEILEIVNEIDRNRPPSPYLKYAKEIKKWIEESGDTKPPSSTSTNEEERRLGMALINIRYHIIKSYMNLESEEEREAFREKNPDADEILEIVNEIDSNRPPSPYLKYAREIKKWIEESGDTKPPSQKSTNEEERRLGKALGRIRQYIIKPYNNLESEEEQEAFREKYPDIDEILEIVNEIDRNRPPSPYLKYAREIKKWIEESGDTKPPSSTSTNEEERRLGIALKSIRERIIKPYMNSESEEEREAFREKNPDADEILEIISEIDRNRPPSKYLKNARDIKKWIEESGDTKLPSSTSTNEEERRLGIALKSIRERIIKPYNNMESEEEQEAYKEKYPDIDEILEIVNEIDKNNISPYLKNARKIKKWIGESGDTKPPSSKSTNEEERRLGIALSSIRQYIIKPYNNLESEEEREAFREKNPDADEILEIISELDMEYGNKTQKKLAALIREDLEKRKMLKDAKKLEQSYEQQIATKKLTKNTQEQGESFNE